MTPFGWRGQRSMARLVYLVCLLAALPSLVLAAPYAAVVMDARSGEIIHARNHDTRLHPASLTKMMTLYIAFEAVERGEISLDTQVRISANAAAEPPSKLGLRSGQTIAFRYLIRAAALRSANDAATAIGEAISGSEAAFAERMTRTARAMGMNDTTFRNADGLTQDGHLSTARDMTTLARQLYFDFPQYYNIFSRRQDDAGIARVQNTNWRLLDSYRGADGIKTGFTNAAGYNLTGSAERGGKRIIATIFGGTSVAQRTARMAELLDMGFQQVPAQVAVRRPPRPNYGAVAVASAEAGRTIRLNTAVTRSPIPPARASVLAAPPEAVIAALQEGIGAALAEAQQEFASAEVTDAVPEPRPEDLVVAVTAPGAADAEAEVLAAAGADPAEPESFDVRVTMLSAAIDAPVPEPRPDAAPAALAEVPAVDEDEMLELAMAVPAGTIEALVSEVMPEAGAAGAAGATEPAEAQETLLPGGIPENLPFAVVASPAPTPEPEPEPQIVLTTSAPPARPAEALVVASAPEAEQAPVPEARPEVISRHLSTSDARLWGINVGRYGSSFDAERVLMQTALVEMGALEGALRRVNRSGGGFDATFIGLTQDQADLACRRLQARDRLCFTMGP